MFQKKLRFMETREHTILSQEDGADSKFLEEISKDQILDWMMRLYLRGNNQRKSKMLMIFERTMSEDKVCDAL